MDLDAAADELYGIPPDDFMARRTALVAAAKQAGDKALATAVTALRKPTRSAWLVNLVARDDPGAVGGLLGLTAELTAAQAAMDGAALRALSNDRRTRIDALVRRAGELGRAAGYAATDGSLPEVASTLQAALGDPAVAEQVRAGRLAQAVAYGGFGGAVSGADEAGGAGDLAAALAASLPAKKERKLQAVPDLPPEADAPDPEPPDPELVERAQRLRAEADTARTALAAAETAADEATTRADALADALEALRTQLRDTEAAERDAREEARAARKALTDARRAAAAASQAAARAEDALT